MENDPMTDDMAARLAAAEEERDRAVERARAATDRAIEALNEKNEALAQNVAIRSLHVEGGKMDAVVAGDFAKFFAVALTQFFRDSGGENYVEMGVNSSDGKDHFVVTVQRVAGKTPHQLRLAAEARAEKAERERDEYAMRRVSVWESALASERAARVAAERETREVADEWEAHCNKIESSLSRAVEALRQIADVADGPAYRIATETLAEEGK